LRRFMLLLAFTATAAMRSIAQDAMSVDRSEQVDSHQEMHPSYHDDHEMMHMESDSLLQLVEHHATAGTDAEPNSSSPEMIMTRKRDWLLMFHGVAFLSATEQSGPRGRDKLFSTNWIMPMAHRRLGRGSLTFRAMLSFEPATVSERQYPLLFQQGETAFAKPVLDGQHPHDFFMELAAMYDYRLSETTLLSLYAAPTGAPALGPVAYPHRSSASENPVAALGHHLEDSTHISDDVITVGITRRAIRLEASGFHGREPDEFRWNIDTGAIDSWSTRVTMNPGQNWSAQYSIGQMHSLEELAPDEDVRRMTASVMYNRPFHNGNWASTLLWGRNQSLEDGNVGNGYLLESTARFMGRNSVWTRIESVDRTNELLLGETPFSLGFKERYFARVQAYTVGYDRDFGDIPHLATAIGGQFTWYGLPQTLRTAYGSHPVGASLFLRVRAR